MVLQKSIYACTSTELRNIFFFEGLYYLCSTQGQFLRVHICVRCARNCVKQLTFNCDKASLSVTLLMLKEIGKIEIGEENCDKFNCDKLIVCYMDGWKYKRTILQSVSTVKLKTKTKKLRENRKLEANKSNQEEQNYILGVNGKIVLIKVTRCR